MEFKVVIYIIMGVLYFIYSMKKKADESASKQGKKQPTINPPVSNPIEEILAEMKKRQQEMETTSAPNRNVPSATLNKKQELKPQKTPKRDLIVKEKKVTAFEEGRSSAESVFERELTPEEKIERGNLKVANEGAYKTESIEELVLREEMEEATASINAREAFIGSLIFERKF